MATANENTEGARQGSSVVDRDDARWYACYTRARAEKKVSEILPRAGIETYLPLIPMERQWADRKKLVDWPLFPSYVFARFPLRDISSVLHVPGVATVVRLGGEYVPLEDSEIANIRRFAEAIAEKGLEALQPVQYIDVGERVRVVDGPFKGVEGIVLRRKKRNRLLVGLSAIQQGFAVDIPAEYLKPI